MTHRTGLRIYCADCKKNPWWEGIRPIAEQYKMAGCITAKESELLWITSNLDLGDTMRERINRLAKGIVDTDIPSLVVQPETVKETVQAGEVTRRELTVTDGDGLFVKGLAYSSNIRVRVRNHAFGGNRNHISYEIDSTYLGNEDVIEGAFYLVTNGGERKVPYSFSIELGVSGRTLDSLKTASDFAGLARRDQETALRLFEYQDFTEAPFMQDLHVRTLYDGLKGRINRPNLLEEFLVALGVKDPVTLKVGRQTRTYDNIRTSVQDFLEVKSSTWGYVQFEVSADGDFIELPRRTFGQADFQDGVCRMPFTINPDRLHGGRNLGAITITSVREKLTVCVEAQGGEDSVREYVGERAAEHNAAGRYLSLRLDYEIGLYEERLMLNQMRAELERVRKECGASGLNTLLQAELAFLEGETDRASLYLEECRSEITSCRQEQKELYCFLQYLQMLLAEKEGQRETLLRLVKKYLSEDRPQPYLLMLCLRLEPELADRPAEVLELLKEQFAKGGKSPFLYAAAYKIYRNNLQLLRQMDEFDLQVMIFAMKRGLMDKELAGRAAQLAGLMKHYHKLYARLLVKLYEKYPEKEFLSAVCGMMIKGDCRGEQYFKWYQQALEQGVSLTRLYEYFLYSLPKNYPYLMPKEVLMYFSYEKSMDDYSRSVLYQNIIQYMSPSNSLYKQYEREIEKFTIDQLLKSRINQRLVVLYQHMIYKEMIDEKIARVLPAILKSFRVQLRGSRMKYVIVRYEELDEEDAFLIQDGTAYVPLFLERTVLLFQDEYGNRYANIPYRKLPAMDKDNITELEEQCFDMYPSHPMLRLKECGEIAEKGIADDADMVTLKRACVDLKLHPLYRKRILSRMIEYYQEQLDRPETEAGDDADYLLSLDFDKLTRKERASVCETLIRQDYLREAYDLIGKYGCEGIRSVHLFKMCSKLILQQLFTEDDLLISLACRLFSEGKYDSVLLDYLCEYFNGSGKQMYRILNQAVREQVDVYDLPERLLAQMMFTGTDDRIDQVFDWYAGGKKTSDSLVKAYFTVKSVEYFLKERPAAERVFAYLEGLVQRTEDKYRIPTIYLLALTKYYSALKELNDRQKELCRAMADILIEEGRIFAWFKDLGKLIPMPDSIMDQVVIEYHGDRQLRPELWIRILPEEEEYSCESMRRVYPGIYVRQKVLFEGEILEYQIYETRREDRELKKEGSISCDPDAKRPEGSRFAALNEMGLCLSLKEEEALKEKMKKYVTDSAAMEELFPLM